MSKFELKGLGEGHFACMSVFSGHKLAGVFFVDNYRSNKAIDDDDQTATWHGNRPSMMLNGELQSRASGSRRPHRALQRL